MCIWNGKLFHNKNWEKTEVDRLAKIEMYEWQKPHWVISVDMSFPSSVSPQSLIVNQLLVKLRFLQTFSGVLQKTIHTRSVFNETPAI